MSTVAAYSVSLEGVTHRYGETTAVDTISLAIEAGEFFTLVGPSGCGKTTTLRLVGGFESPTEGIIRLNGSDVSGTAPEDRDIGIVFQNYALFPHMNVAENIAYGLQFTEPPDGVSTDERVEELLALVDLPGMGTRDPDQLSGGQQQRVALARALAPGPSVLLLDEPLSALDAALREQLRVKLREIQRELGITALYVTHDQAEALAISDRVAVMNAGRIEQVGSPREIYRTPQSRFVAEFIGDNNLFTGEVTDRSSRDETATVRVADSDFEIGLGNTTVDVGTTVTFCVRPEALVIDSDQNQLATTVRSREFLGETTRLHLDWNGRELLARSTEPPTEMVTVGFAPADAHIVATE